MTTKHIPIWDQLHKYLPPEDLQAIGENSILDYLQTKYGLPDENTVQADLTEFIFDIQDRKVHFWQQDSTRELLGVGGIDAALLCALFTPKIIATIVAPNTASISLLGILVRGLPDAISAAIAEASVSSALVWYLKQKICTRFCQAPCFCSLVPANITSPEVTVKRRWGVPVNVTVSVTFTHIVLCL